MNFNNQSLFRQGISHSHHDNERLRRYPFSYLRYDGEKSIKYEFNIQSEMENYLEPKRKKRLKNGFPTQEGNNSSSLYPVILLNENGSDNDAIRKAAKMLGLECFVVGSDNLKIVSNDTDCASKHTDLLQYNKNNKEEDKENNLKPIFVGNVHCSYFPSDVDVDDSIEKCPTEFYGNLWVATTVSSSGCNDYCISNNNQREPSSRNACTMQSSDECKSTLADNMNTGSTTAITASHARLGNKQNRKQRRKTKQKLRMRDADSTTDTKNDPNLTGDTNNSNLKNSEGFQGMSGFTSYTTKDPFEYSVARPFYSMSDSNIFASIGRRILSKILHYPQLDMHIGLGVPVDEIITGDPYADVEADRFYNKYYRNSSIDDNIRNKSNDNASITGTNCKSLNNVMSLETSDGVDDGIIVGKSRNARKKLKRRERKAKFSKDIEISTRIRASSSVLGEGVLFDPLFQQHYATLKTQREREKRSVVSRTMEFTPTSYMFDSNASVSEVDEDKLHYSYLVRSFDMHPLMHFRSGLL